MSATQPFSPHHGSNQVVTLAAATPQAVSIEITDRNLRVSNAGVNPVHVRAYSSRETVPPVAGLNECVVLPNMVGTFTKSLGQDRVSLFSTLGSTVHICTGEGW